MQKNWIPVVVLQFLVHFLSYFILEEDVRTQWKNLKDTYKRKLKRRQAEANAGYEDVEPTWRFWSKMQFVKNNFGPDRNRSSALNR